MEDREKDDRKVETDGAWVSSCCSPCRRFLPAPSADDKTQAEDESVPRNKSFARDQVGSPKELKGGVHKTKHLSTEPYKSRLTLMAG